MWQRWLRDSILAAVLCALSVAGCIPAQGPAKEGAAPRGLVGYWTFDEGSGAVVKDAAGHGCDGEIRHAEWVTGAFGTALHFNGENSCVIVPEVPGLKGSDALSVAAWVFWEGVGRYPNVLTCGGWNPGGFMIFVHDTQCSFRMGKPGPAPWQVGKNWEETSAVLLRPLQLGRWYHLAATFKRPAITTYVDGEMAGSATWNFPAGPSGKTCIGTWTEEGLGASMFHYGMIDEVVIYSRALSRDEIEADYRREASRRK